MIYKFRAWDKIDKKWLFGYEYPNLGGFSLTGETVLLGELNTVSLERWNDIEITHSIGRHDKEGCELYLRDIVKYAGLIGEIKQLYGGAYYIDHPEVSIKYAYQIHCEVCDTDSPVFFLSFIESFEIEKLGTIMENPELLKGE